MARVNPPLHTIQVTSQGLYTEVQVLRQLAETLPDSFELFHSVDWTQSSPDGHEHGDAHGEIDIVVLNQAGDIALLEVKAGGVEFTPQGLFKTYRNGRRNISQQVGWQFSGIQHRLRSAQLGIRLMNLLLLPDVDVPDHIATARFPRERLLDRTECKTLGQAILARLGSGQPHPVRERVCAFLLDHLQCKVDVATLAGHLQHWTQHLSGGLAEWVPRIQAPGRIVRVQATAGSGKTQLALCLLRQAATIGRRAAYICFNRPLAEHMREIAPAACEVQTFHQLCWATAPAAAGTRITPEALDQSVQGYAEHMAHTPPDLDLLVVDELQDFKADWLQSLVGRVAALDTASPNQTPSTRTDGLYLLDDPDQCLYDDREELDIADAVVVDCQDNHRNPRRVVDTLNQFGLAHAPIQARSPFVGELPTFRTWKLAVEGELQSRTAEAVQACLDAGYALDQICVLTWRGRKRSQLLYKPALGPWALIQFTGRLDEQQRAVFTEGDLHIETLRRFKGQSAPAVVLTEIDFDAWSDLNRRLLFVGMTRASMHLELVLSDRAEQLLMGTLAGV